MQTLGFLSGLIAMSIAWLMIVVIPLVILPIKHKTETISSALARHSTVLYIVSISLVIGAFFQGWFFWSVVAWFGDLRAGMFVLLISLSMSLATVLAAAFSPVHKSNLHYYSALYYFCIAPFVMAFIGLEFKEINRFIYILSVMCAGTYIVGNLLMMLWYRSMKNAHLEIYCFFILSVWTVMLTFTLWF
jgi:hypothetical protein